MNVDKKWAFLDHLPTSSCKSSLWTTPKALHIIWKYILKLYLTCLLGENDVSIKQFDEISSIVQFPPLHTAEVTGLCYSHLEKKMTFSAATTEDVMLGSQLIDDKKQIPQYSTYFKCLCWKLLLKKYYYYLQVNLCQKLLFLHQLTHNITKDCSLNYKKSTSYALIVHTIFVLFWHSEQFMCKTCSELGISMHLTCNLMNTLSSYCGLVDARIHKWFCKTFNCTSL